MALRIDIDGKVYRLPRRIPASVMRALVDWGRVSKSLTLYKSVTEPGYKWITVHPQGEESGGMPVKIKVNPDGTGTVVAGAGGSLNAMKLTKLRSPEEWKQTAQERKARRKQAQDALPDEAKKAQRETRRKLRDAEAEAKAKYLAAVSSTQGWEEPVSVPEALAEQMTDEQRAGIERRRQREMIAKADRIIRNARVALLEHQDTEMAQALGEEPLGLIDTSSQRDTTGLGYAANIVKTAQENGLLPEQAQALAEETAQQAIADAEAAGYLAQGEAARHRGGVQKQQAGAAAAREALKPFLEQGAHKVAGSEEADPAKIKELLMAEQEYKDAMATIRKQRAKLGRANDVDEVLEVARGVSLVVGEGVNTKTQAQLEQALKDDQDDFARTEKLVTLLSTIEDVQANRPEAAPAQVHVNTGRYAEMQDAVQGIMQEPCPIDRLVADHLGLDATATLLANLWKRKYQSNSAMMRSLTSHLQQFHQTTQATVANQAATDAQALIQEADELLSGLDLTDCDADTLLSVQMLNEHRQELLDEAAATLGTALGRLEFIGTLNFAMLSEQATEVRASLGQMDPQRGHEIAHALGLERHEYELVKDLNNLYLTLRENGEQKLVREADEVVRQEQEDTLEIKRGGEDEPGWLPEGFSREAKSIEDLQKPQEATSFRREIAIREDMTDEELREEVTDFLDRALADNPYNPRAVRDSARTSTFIDRYVPQHLQKQYDAVLGEYFPKDEIDGKKWAAWAAGRVEEAVQKLIHRGEVPADAQGLGAQAMNTDLAEKAIRATLAEAPELAFAYMEATEETRSQILTAARDYFWQNLTTEDREEVAAQRAAKRAEEQKKVTVVGQETDLFGGVAYVLGDGRTVSPEQLQKIQAEAAAAPIEYEQNAWDRFASSFASIEDAHEAVRDHMRGTFMERLAAQYSARHGTALKAGTRPVPNRDRFVLGTLNKDERERKIAQEKEDRASLGAKVTARDERGRFLTGERRSQVDQILESRRNAVQGTFGFDEQQEYRDLSDRFTLGETIEKQLQTWMPSMAVNVRPGGSFELAPARPMDGEYVAQQRAIRLVDRMKRIGVHADTGIGKTVVALGAFTHLHSQGKVKRGLFAVPSVVAGQFPDEAARFVETRIREDGRNLRWRTAAGQPMSQRMKWYADPDVDMVFVTHEALRNDITYLIGREVFGSDVTKAAQWLQDAPEEERRNTVQRILREAGWGFDYSVLDEGHNLLNRQGKKNSVMANAIDDFTAGHEYHLNCTATPVKNDVSEAFDILHKLRPDRYPTTARKEFMRRFGVDTQATADALAREMGPYVFGAKLDIDCEKIETDHDVKLSQAQADAYRQVLDAYRTAQTSEPGSPGHIAAMRTLSPDAFNGVSDEEARAVAIERGTAAGMLRDVALLRIQRSSADIPPEQNAALQETLSVVQSYANQGDDGQIMPGIIFSHHHADCRLLRDQLRKAGYRVGYMTGEQQGNAKDAARLGFYPPLDVDGMTPAERESAWRGAAKFDVLIASDAAACGANLQRAGWVVHYDQSMTAKTHKQRTGRGLRHGQLRGKFRVHNIVLDTPLDRKNRERVLRKYALGEIFQEPVELLDDTGRAGQYRRQFHSDREEDARKITGTQEQAWPEGRAAE